jgi:ATP-binding cassette subfamily B multidrug efflux pump
LFKKIKGYRVSRQINLRSTLIQSQLSDLTSSAQEAYSGVRVVKSYVREAPIVKHFAGESDVYKNKTMNLARIDNAFFPIMLFCISLSVIITVYVGGIQVVNGSITPGNIAEFVIYVNMLTWPVTSIGWIASLSQQAAASMKRINAFMHTEPAIKDGLTDDGLTDNGNTSDREIQSKIQNPKSKIEGAIEFNNVSFIYPDTGIQALKNINFSIKRGEKLAIIGRTGSGKTTIADLLVRLYDVTAGTILIDGKDIRTLPLSVLRKSIGFVPQDVFLFSDSIAGNISFGKADATRPEVEQFSKFAAVHEDILSLPQQFDTMVGERGVTLSGGQKQRVSIARALIKKPEIVIMDDSLSAVDTTTEQTILGYLTDALADKTSIIITHRIYGLLTFDKIIVLDNGEIIEQGTHEALMAKQGYYYEMYSRSLVDSLTR